MIYIKLIFLSFFINLVVEINFIFAANEYHVGVYFFPGWNYPQSESSEKIRNPWTRILPYPEREPLLGWYNGSESKIIDQQLKWMHHFGINFVLYDWYWSSENVPTLNYAIDGHRKSTEGDKVKYALLWANHTNVPTSTSQFDQMVEYWIDNYFVDSRYYLIDDYPVVFIFSPTQLEIDARRFFMNSDKLLTIARRKAREKGLKGIYFVACAQAIDREVGKLIPEAGYNAISAYNYHYGLSGEKINKPRMSKSYRELIDGYKESWTWIIKNSPLPYFLPVSSGWDKRPWGGSKEREHDNSFGNPHDFYQHLMDAKNIIDKEYLKTKGTVVICCWNEYGEGSYIEPTKFYRFRYLEALKEVFGSSDANN